MPEDDGEPRSKRIEIFDILWDMDAEERQMLELPTQVVTTLADVEEAADPYADEEDQGNMMHMIGDWLTSTYDARLSNFDYSM